MMHSCTECGRECRCTAVLLGECECFCRKSTDDDAPYLLPDEFEGDDDDQCDYSEEDVIS